MQLPEQDRYAYDRGYLMDRIAVLFGGRVAEELFMHQMTTGASNDFERATSMARDMVTRYGMSDLGPMVYGENEGKPARDAQGHVRSHHAESGCRNLSYHRRAICVAKRLLDENRDKVEAMTQALLEWETIDADQINDIMAGKAPRPPHRRAVLQPAAVGTCDRDQGAPATA
jgi:cell division protease FtsH